MSSEIDEFRTSLVAAVQAELERHASALVAEIDRIREEGRKERGALRSELTEQIRAIGQVVEQSQEHAAAQHDKARTTFEQRLEEAESRQNRRLDDATAGLEGMVQSAARPILQQVSDDQEALAHKVDGLDNNLRKFDEQAARMVTYFNDMSEQIEQRQDQVSAELREEVTGQVDPLKKLVEDNDSAIRRFQNEISQSVSQRVGDAEDRFNNRLLAAESRMKEEAGQKIAEIDAHVGRINAGLDDTMTVLNDRVAGLDDRFVEYDRQIAAMKEDLDGIDQEALEELENKLSTAAGEAMLVRIEMERLEKGVNERSDEIVVRMTELETQMADATMDVSTAVQLDRLEDIERALVELDPAKFVLRDEVKKSKKDADDDSDEYADVYANDHADAN